jgi:hypothetical protein
MRDLFRIQQLHNRFFALEDFINEARKTVIFLSRSFCEGKTISSAREKKILHSSGSLKMNESINSRVESAINIYEANSLCNLMESFVPRGVFSAFFSHQIVSRNFNPFKARKAPGARVTSSNYNRVNEARSFSKGCFKLIWQVKRAGLIESVSKNRDERSAGGYR